MWQDIVLAVGAALLGLAVLPMVIAETRLPVASSLPTAIILSVFGVTYATLELSAAGITQALTAVLWWRLAYISLSR